MKNNKFRVWDSGDQVMYKEYIGIQTEPDSRLKSENQVLFCNDRNDMRVNTIYDVVIMQYTCYNDVKDNPIYEGDILEYIDDKIKYIVTFEKGCFKVENSKDGTSDLLDNYHFDDFTIVGNIFENKYLLKPEKNKCESVRVKYI